MRKPSCISGMMLAVALAGCAIPFETETPLTMEVAFTHGPQKPTSIPIVPDLNAGRSMYGEIGRLAKPGDYEPTGDGGFRKHNGPRAFNYIVTSGAWWLHVGDKPRVSMALRMARGAYAQPALLPGLGVAGQLRIAVTCGEKTKWLDLFDSIDAILEPGAGRWRCSDKELGVALDLEARPFIGVYGFGATAKLTGEEPKEAQIVWVFGKLGGKPDSVEIRNDCARLSTPGLKYTQVFVGLEEKPARIGVGEEKQDSPGFNADAEQPLALLVSKLRAKPRSAGNDGDATARSRFVCVWGYSDYDRQGVADAHKRLEFRPFPDPQWVEEMKKQWFHHWIGKGLEPQKKFLALRADPESALAESREFWDRQRRRVRIKTPDPRFDNVVNSTAALLRMQYEYPSFIHGLTYCKYGKINCGYYGMIAAGYREEVESSLKFISGTQCVKGRQRYFMPAFSLSPWAEEVNFYFVDQVWQHYRWTGDEDFLRAMWPSVRRALEHAIHASDPDGDGLMTGYYEMWNADTYARGGKCALQTGMGWAALRAGAEMAAVLRDKDHDSHGSSIQGPFPPEFDKRYALLMKRSEDAFNKHLWNKEIGAWCSAEWNGDLRPRPANHEENYHIWRGLGDPMRNYMAMRYVRDHLWLEESPGVVGEFNNIWWPIMWSHHYVANGDTAASIASACATGDVDNFWPAMKTIYESAYTGSNAALYHATGSHSQEMDTLFIWAVVDGMFGVKPSLAENLLALRPSLLSDWPEAEIELDSVSYRYSKGDNAVSLHVATPADRRVRAELPVTRSIEGATLNGQPAPYSLEPGVNCCRVVIESPAGREQDFVVRLGGREPAVSGDLLVLLNQQTRFTVSDAEVAQARDPQEKTKDLTIRKDGENRTSVSFVPTETGKFTLFLELRAGETTWLHPLDLEARRPWEIVETVIPAFNEGGPAIASPRMDAKNRKLIVEVRNNTASPMAGAVRISVAGGTLEEQLRVPPRGTSAATVSLEEIWERLSPGTVPFLLEFEGQTQSGAAVSWATGEEPQRADFGRRLAPVDISPYCNVNLRHLYSPNFQWRIDYAGCNEGVDWRDPIPNKDDRGYVIMNAPISQFEYGVLIEQFHCTAEWDAPRVRSPIRTPVGVSFLTGGEPYTEGEGEDATPWTQVRAEGRMNSWVREGDAAVMAIEGPARASNGYAYGPLDASTDEYARLRARLSGTENALYFIQLSDAKGETVFRSEWLDAPSGLAQERVFDLPPGQKIAKIVLYTMTEDGKRAENRFEALALAGEKREMAIDLENVEPPPPPPTGEKDILALVSTEPYEQLPSAAVMRLKKPMALEKIYLLTANLTKTLKCYYPGAEVVVRYEEGDDQIVELAPPFNMSCMVQHFNPRALPIPFGQIVNGGHPLNRGKDCHLAVTDLVLDPERKAREIEFRCVASETIFGIVGVALLRAP